MGATLCPLSDLITIDAKSYKDLVISFVSILKQVAERRLPKSYDYHQMPAPFIQVCLIILGLNVVYKHSCCQKELLYMIIVLFVRFCEGKNSEMFILVIN